MKTYAQTQSPALASVFDNLENGNLADAKRQAKRFSFHALYEFAIYQTGFGTVRAHRAAAYLKGMIDFNTYCNTASETPSH
jgi:hypothetical protein